MTGLVFFALSGSLVCSTFGEPLSKNRFVQDSKAPWEIRAKKLSYDGNTQTYSAEGNVVIKKGEQVLRAAKATYSKATGIARVWGGFNFESFGDTLSGEEGVFNLHTKTARVLNGRLFLKENHFYISGSLMERLSEDTYLVREATITTCEGCPPQWSITCAELRVTIEGYGRAKHTAFRIRNFPVLYVPYFLFSAKTKRQTGLLPPRLGYSDINGLDMEIPFFWAISKNTDATFYQRFLTERGYMQGLEFRYAAPKDSRGDILFDILSDRKEKKDLKDQEELDISPYPRTNTTRYWFRGRIDQGLWWGVRLFGDFDYVSDQDYLREFETGLFGYEARPDLEKQYHRPFEERFSPLRTTRVKLVKFSQDHYAELSSSYYQLPGDISSGGSRSGEDYTPQPIVLLKYALPLKPLVPLLPLHASLDSSWSRIWREEGQKGHEMSVTPSLQVPISVGPYIKIEPHFNYTRYIRVTEEFEGEDNDASQGIYNLGIKLFTKVERRFILGGKGAITGLKHTIWPTLSYSFRGIHPEEDDSPWFGPPEASQEENRVVFSLENYLDARVGVQGERVKYRQLVSLKLTQGYDIREARADSNEPGQKKEPFDPLEMVLSVRPLKALDLYGTLKWDHYDQEIVSSHVSADLSIKRVGSKRDRYSVEYSYEQGGDEYLSATAQVNLWWGYSAGASVSRDLVGKSYVRRSYWVDYQGQCWGIKVALEEEKEDRRVMFFMRFTGLGEIKLW